MLKPIKKKIIRDSRNSVVGMFLEFLITKPRSKKRESCGSDDRLGNLHKNAFALNF